jgi:Protein of unknown function (DUF2752)
MPDAEATTYTYARPDRVVRTIDRVARHTPAWLAPIALGSLCAVASAFVLWSNPTDASADAQPTCLVKMTTGFDCPGCGGTRAMWYLLHGDLPAAAHHHIIAVFAAPFLVYAYVAWAAGVMFNRRLPQLRVSYRSIAALIAAWGVFTLVRNLPFEPFSWFYV